uniref:Uncharacterized protein n=1 Tax=Lotus japonicus TaxID=34305 RepID=I3SI79_LOTJA|nr:unknown [Lotus japonicus]
MNLSDIFHMRVFQACNLLPISPIPEEYLRFTTSRNQIPIRPSKRNAEDLLRRTSINCRNLLKCSRVPSSNSAI